MAKYAEFGFSWDLLMEVSSDFDAWNAVGISSHLNLAAFARCAQFDEQKRSKVSTEHPIVRVPVIFTRELFGICMDGIGNGFIWFYVVS